MFGSFGFWAANARTGIDTDPRRNLTVFYSIKPNNRTSSRKSLCDGVGACSASPPQAEQRRTSRTLAARLVKAHAGSLVRFNRSDRAELAPNAPAHCRGCESDGHLLCGQEWLQQLRWGPPDGDGQQRVSPDPCIRAGTNCSVWSPSSQVASPRKIII
jgi:hypothetical protein